MDIELFSDEIRERERARRRKEPLWGLLSFLLHCGLFVTLVLLTPVKSLVFEPKKQQSNAAADLSADRIEDIGETLSDVRLNELMKQIEAMQAVLHNMDVMKEELAKDYDTFAAKTAQDVRSELEKLVKETEDAQNKSVEAQEVVKSEIREIAKVETQKDLAKKEVSEELRAKRDKLMYETVEKTNTAQANAVNALDKLEVKAAFTGFEKTAKAAEKFREAQMEVAKLQDATQTEVIDTAEQLVQVANNEKWIADREKEIEKLKEKNPTNLADQLKRREEQLKPAYEKRAALEKLRQERAEKQVEVAQKSQTAQEELNKQIDLLKQTLAADAAELKKLAQEDSRRENALVQEDSAQLSMSKAYDLAKNLENAITESYKDIKATETAIAKKMSFEAAQKLTDVAKPERLVADAAALETKVRTKEALDRQKEAQTEVVREADSMVEATVAMMEEAIEIVLPGDMSSQLVNANKKPKEIKWLEEKDLAERSTEAAEAERMAAMDAAADYQVKLENAAAEDNSQKAKDLAELMARAAAEAEDAKVKDKDKGQLGSIQDQGKTGEMIGTSKGPPDLAGGTIDLQPGNVLHVVSDATGGMPAKWMYVSSWYVIGPFPNPNRVNLRRKFAPESVVDLDATYVGKDGRVLKWKFQQSRNVDEITHWGANMKNASEVIPTKSEEYAIYYAYAEVFVDRACDRWVAIGSDDRSDVWVNDIPVWGSSNKLKAWTLAEDFRRVHFNRGRNRILVRIENGHWNVGWSVCIAVDDDLEVKK
jgi:hypothetical protein